MKRFASIVSAVFSPLFIPTYAVTMALLASILMYVDTQSKIWVICSTLAITGVTPLIVIFFLHRFGRISDVGLNSQGDRTIPYIISLVCYAGEAWFLYSVHSPAWLLMFVVGGSVALLIDLLVNIKWKISAHATGMGGFVALGFYIISRSLNVWPMQWLVMTLIILAGIVCTCRLILQRHTIWQLLAGFANGFICVMLATSLVY